MGTSSSSTHSLPGEQNTCRKEQARLAVWQGMDTDKEQQQGSPACRKRLFPLGSRPRARKLCAWPLRMLPTSSYSLLGVPDKNIRLLSGDKFCLAMPKGEANVSDVRQENFKPRATNLCAGRKE